MNFSFVWKRLKLPLKSIIAQLPESALNVLHPSQPYWHWAKKDRDHLELLRKKGQASITNQLSSEMKQLMDAYYKVEQEKVKVQGLNFFSSEVTGKLDALSRGLEARYMLLAQHSGYQYPDIAKSTPTSLKYDNNRSSNYTVSDHSFMDIAKSGDRLLKEISTNTDLPFQSFRRTYHTQFAL